MATDMMGFPKKGGLDAINIDLDNQSVLISGLEIPHLTQPDKFPPNKLGQGAVDIQTQRTASTQVASGVGSLAIGQRNTASGLASIALGGGSAASGPYSLAIGNASIASALGSFSMGGGNVSGQNGVGLGQENTVLGSSSVALGFRNTTGGIASIASGYQASNFSVNGRNSHSSMYFASAGDCQKSSLIIRASTTDETPTILTVDALTATALNTVVLQNNNSISFMGQIVVRQTASTVSSSWKIEGLIIRGTTAASTVLVTSTVTAISNATAIPTPVFTANTTLGCLALTVTGIAATSLRWMASIQSVELIYA
jgi:hypothetical protein